MSPAEAREEIVTVECPNCHRWHASPASKALTPCWWCRRGIALSTYTDGVDRSATMPTKGAT